MLDFAVARSVMTGLNIDRMGGSVASFDNLYLPRSAPPGAMWRPMPVSEHIASPGGFVLDSESGHLRPRAGAGFQEPVPKYYPHFFYRSPGSGVGMCQNRIVRMSRPYRVTWKRRFARQGHILPANSSQQLWQQRDGSQGGR